MSLTINNPFDTRIAITYASKARLLQGLIKLRQRFRLNNNQLTIIQPGERLPSRKLEGESEDVAVNMLTAHVKYTLFGLGLGMAVAISLILFGPAIFSSHPVFTIIGFISPSLFLGAFWGGLRSLKPERDPINQTAVAASMANEWTLIVETSKGDISKDAITSEIEDTDFLDVVS
jgi:hypothetical protein